MRHKLTRCAALLGPFVLINSGCLNLGLEPSVGGVLSSVVVSGQALAEFVDVRSGAGTIIVSGQIVGRFRCDTVEGDVKEQDGEYHITIIVISGRQACNSLSPTTFSFAANIFNIAAGLHFVAVEFQYVGVEGQSGIREETDVTVG